MNALGAESDLTSVCTVVVSNLDVMTSNVDSVDRITYLGPDSITGNAFHLGDTSSDHWIMDGGILCSFSYDHPTECLADVSWFGGAVTSSISRHMSDKCLEITCVDSVRKVESAGVACSLLLMPVC